MRTAEKCCEPLREEVIDEADVSEAVMAGENV